MTLVLLQGSFIKPLVLQGGSTITTLVLRGGNTISTLVLWGVSSITPLVFQGGGRPTIMPLVLLPLVMMLRERICPLYLQAWELSVHCKLLIMTHALLKLSVFSRAMQQCALILSACLHGASTARPLSRCIAIGG